MRFLQVAADRPEATAILHGERRIAYGELERRSRAFAQVLRRQGAFAEMPTPDLVLLDLNLPRRDGREVLEDIKQDPQLKHIPVVILTSSQADEDILRSYRLHANCFITKPVDLEQLTKVVQGIEQFWFTLVKLPPEI